MKSIDELIQECDSQKSCVKCSNYFDCLAKFRGNHINNPSTISAEIKNFDIGIYKDENTQENYRVNIDEADQMLINKALIMLLQMENSLEVNIIRSALFKFSADINNSAEIFKSKDNKYHLVFECVDCMAINDSTEYVNGDNIIIYCKYCGKKHKFNISKENDND